MLNLNPAIFAVLRRAPAPQSDTVLCLVNVSGRAQTVELDPVSSSLPSVSAWHDLFSGRRYLPHHLTLAAYEVLWLRPSA